MEEFTKVEKLREATGVTFEDARNAIRACDGDMIDAMVYLEKLGKGTTYLPTGMDKRAMPITAEEIAAVELKRAIEEAEKNYRPVKMTRRERKEAKREARREAKREARRESAGRVGNFLRRVFAFLTHNKLTISKDGREFANIPLLAVLIIGSTFFGFALAAVIISMVCGYEYSLNGVKKEAYVEAYSEAPEIRYDEDLIEQKMIEAQLKREELKRLGSVAEI